MHQIRHHGNRPIGHTSIPYSPRQILQWWGTEYRKVRDRILSCATKQDWVVTDVRFQNEAGLVQELGGQIGQEKSTDQKLDANI